MLIRIIELFAKRQPAYAVSLPVYVLRYLDCRARGESIDRLQRNASDIIEGTDTVTLPARVDMKNLDGRQKAVLAGISKQFHASRSPERLEHFRNIIRLHNID